MISGYVCDMLATTLEFHMHRSSQDDIAEFIDMNAVGPAYFPQDIALVDTSAVNGAPGGRLHAPCVKINVRLS